MSELKDFVLPNEPTCIVVSSASAARLWRSTTRFGDWTEIAEMRHPEAAEREGGFASDRPGRSFDSFGKGRHAMSATSSGQEHEAAHFAGEVAERINGLVTSGDVSNVVLIAEHRFLGHLREKLSDAATDAVILEASKNLVGLDAEEIKNYFQ